MKTIRSIIVFLALFVIHVHQAQDISNIATIEVDSLSDKQVASFWEKAKQKGYTLEQLEVMAKAKNMPALQIEKLKYRIRQLQTGHSEKSDEGIISLNQENLESPFGLTGNEIEREELKNEKESKNKLYGYDFFNNPKMSFVPNINVATPSTYKIGPGDVLQVDVWGAAEANYEPLVNKQGKIKISGVGTISVSGLSMEKATSKIKSSLRKIYAGINASSTSYNKVHVDVSLAKIRTVQVNLIGELKAPGTYSLNALSTVLNALYAAGGPTENGTFREVELIRGGTKIASFDIYKYLTKGREEGNMQLQDQDLIIVKPYKKLVTIEGQVKRAGIYEMKEGETMKDLIYFCGGFTPLAYKDLIVLERVNGKNREVKEVSYNQIANFLLNGGDKIIISKILDKYKNRVTIKGAVFHPGSYELTPEMTLKNLIDKASGVKEEAFLNRALLVRQKDKTAKKILSFSVLDILNNNKNILLESDDEVIIYNKEELREKRYITVNGAVNTPKKIDYMKGMTIEDAIVLSGGLKEGADSENVEVSRRLKDGNFETVGKSFTLSASDELTSNVGSPFELEPYDIVSIRYIKGYSPQKNVTIKGEVEYPGNYSITTKNERISDLIERAGGLTPYAYIEGASLMRKRGGQVDTVQEEILGDIKEKSDEVDNSDVEIKAVQSIGIDLEEIMNNKGTKIDLILEEGDELLIPSAKQTVDVQGKVFSPSLVQYVPGKSLKYYIQNAGGFFEDARKSKVYVIYANGSIKTTKSFLGIKSYPKVLPGSVIVVPAKKPSKNGISLQEILGITTSLATIALLVNQLVKK